MGNCLKCRNGDSQTGSEDGRRETREQRTGFISGYFDNDPIMYPAPGISRHMSQLTEEEQVKIATRMGLITTLPLFKYDEDKREKLTECIICMCEYEVGEELRYLPCLHTYHRVCIDDWLMRSLTCPSCLEEIRPASLHGTRSADSIRNGDRPALATTTSGISTTTNGEPPAYSTIAPIPSSTSQGVGDSLITATTNTTTQSSASNNNRRGGDGLNVITFVPQPSSHRRTRSNGQFPVQLDNVPGPPSYPDRYRRGNSTSDVQLPSPAGIGNAASSTAGPARVSAAAARSIRIYRQMDGDSHETHRG